MTSNPNRLSWVFAVGAAVLLLAQVGLARDGLVLAVLALASAVIALSLRVPRLRSAGLFLTSFLLCLAMAEGLIPWLIDSPADKVAAHYPPNYWSRGDLGTQPNAGRFPTTKLGPDGKPIYKVTYTIGSDHLRVTPASSADAARRVNFLGCSVTYGEGLEDDQTLPHYFALQLAQVQAKNFAFQGYGPQQALAILQSQRDTRGQVNFFLTAPWHALRSACKPAWTLGSPRYALVNGQELQRAGVCGDAGGWLPPSVSRGMLQSALYRTSRELLTSRATDADMELYLAMVKEMAQISRARGQRFVVGFLKADEAFFQGTSYSNQRVAAELAARVDELIDETLAPSAEAIPRQNYLHELDRHPSAEANRERARLLAERLGPYLGPGAQLRQTTLH